MQQRRPFLTGVERTFGEDEIIVSKTDPKGIITYANLVFLRIAEFEECELLGKPHNIIRHPDMPRCVFQLLWDTLQAGREIFAYVVNRAKNGDHYWVLAHVTPTFDVQHRIVGYHSSRRRPRREAVDKARQLYDVLLSEESKYSNPRQACEASLKLVTSILRNRGLSYDEFVFSL
jgi:PAS domain S-box-containing protein